MRARRVIRWMVVYPLLGIMALHFLTTGSPIPLWRLESLKNPVAVSAVRPSGLLLANGRVIPLPRIAALPVDNPLFQTAIAEGVEVGDDGEVYGLLWHDLFCGNDPVRWKRLRVNLSDLACSLFPDGIDDRFIDEKGRRLMNQLRTELPTSVKAGNRTGTFPVPEQWHLNSVRRMMDNLAAARQGQPDNP